MGFYMEYKIKDICSKFGFGVSKFYKLKTILDNSIPEQNRMEFYFNKGRKFFITDKGFEWFKNNVGVLECSYTAKDKIASLSIEHNQVIDMYKSEIKYLKQQNEYLQSENKRLLDIISVKEQKELAIEVKQLENKSHLSLWDKIKSFF